MSDGKRRRIQNDLGFRSFRKTNRARAERWHKGGIFEWSVSDWAMAMAGEAGEVCNAVKKLRRIQDDLPNISDSDRQLSTAKAAVDAIGEELADTFIYLDLLAQRLDIDLLDVIVKKFNKVSERYGFPERLQGAREAARSADGRTVERRARGRSRGDLIHA